jgi:hypothetical protein
MIETATRETFAECGAKEYRLKLETGEELTLKLTEASPIETQAKGAGRVQFSLLFTGPPEPVLQQAIYTLENDELGELALFLVPVAADEEGADYEAVFT